MSSERDLVREVGLVERLEGDRAFVSIDRPTACETCGARSVCHGLGDEPHIVEVHNDIGAVKGQRVELGLRPAAVVTASLLMFLLPAAAFITGIIGGYALADACGWNNSQWVGFAFGASAFFIVFLVLRLMTKRFENSKKYEPVITKILK
jgi:sigma-E factor negative regulatory protein RseC